MAGTIIKADVAPIVPEVIAQEALTYLGTKLHLARNVTKEAEIVPASKIAAVGQGDKVVVPTTGTLVAHQKAEGGDVLIQDPTMDKVEITIDQHWEVTIAPEDYAQAVADRNIQDTYLGDMINVLAEKIESYLAGVAQTFTQRINAGSSLDEDDFLTARAYLTNNRAPLDGRFGYWDTGSINKMLKIDRFTTVEKYGANTSIQDGEIGKIHGFRNFESVLVPATVGSASHYDNFLMHKRAMVLAMRPLPTPRGGGVKVSTIVDPNSGLAMRALYSYNADKLADQLTLDVLFGAGKLRDEFGVVVETS